MHSVVDLRSDTVTVPTPEMRRAMFEAEVGDDVFGDDPTVNRLQEMSAALLGKEAALFVPSGTMGNQVAIHTHVRPGEEILLEESCHILSYELAAASVISGAQTRPLKGVRGIPAPADVERAVHIEDDHTPGTALLCLENTHNLAGGTVLSPEGMRALCETAHRNGLKVHLDGARLFNAAVALGGEARLLADGADSVMFCLSKGLACPVGSLLCGSREFIVKAHRNRKMFGGGMRQVGIIAAAGIVALETMIARLTEDHARCRRLAEGISRMPGLSVDMASVQTNILYFQVGHPRYTAEQLVQRLAREGILCLNLDARSVRLVTHKDVDSEDIDRALEVLEQVTGEL
ncbi:MAG: low specificity L-threonine aldolase [Armatimonadetes bacterium]|nr:low specificity L-threonine aldolase [Armatimonadota bacterium]